MSIGCRSRHAMQDGRKRHDDSDRRHAGAGITREESRLAALDGKLPDTQLLEGLYATDPEAHCPRGSEREGSSHDVEGMEYRPSRWPGYVPCKRRSGRFEPPGESGR